MDLDRTQGTRTFIGERADNTLQRKRAPLSMDILSSFRWQLLRFFPFYFSPLAV